MTYSELSGPDLNSYFKDPSEDILDIGAPIELGEERSGSGLVFHPERTNGGLQVDEGVFLLGGLHKVYYDQADWVARAAKMKPDTVK